MHFCPLLYCNFAGRRSNRLFFRGGAPLAAHPVLNSELLAFRYRSHHKLARRFSLPHNEVGVGRA
jgi:hypothetical protein